MEDIKLEKKFKPSEDFEYDEPVEMNPIQKKVDKLFNNFQERKKLNRKKKVLWEEHIYRDRIDKLFSKMNKAYLDDVENIKNGRPAINKLCMID